MLSLFNREGDVVDSARALPGRAEPVAVPARHEVLGTPLQPPFPDGVELAIFGMGCFWGAERIFWQAPGVFTTAVGYAGGYTPNPTYEEVCSGATGHTEAVLVAFHSAVSHDRETASRASAGQQPEATTFEAMLRLFWEGHDPTQGMRQGNDVGSQYRSLVLCVGDGQYAQATASLASYQRALHDTGHGVITTELGHLQGDAHELPDGAFYYAEDYHQQYLAKNPNGYCGLSGTGVSCPVGLTGASPAS
ncbi:MAG: peptide-methionine (S)-S-oxide reductase [Solirubrobacteraceae bacterium]